MKRLQVIWQSFLSVSVNRTVSPAGQTWPYSERSLAPLFAFRAGRGVAALLWAPCFCFWYRASVHGSSLPPDSRPWDHANPYLAGTCTFVLSDLCKLNRPAFGQSLLLRCWSLTNLCRRSWRDRCPGHLRSTPKPSTLSIIFSFNLMVFPSLHPNNQCPRAFSSMALPSLPQKHVTTQCSSPPHPEIKHQVTASTTHSVLLCLWLAHQGANFLMLKLPS